MPRVAKPVLPAAAPSAASGVAAGPVLAVLLAVLLAGCAVQLPRAVDPEKQGFAWDDADGDLWVVRLVPCGFGLASAEESCNTLTALYRDGAVLHIAYGEGGPDQAEGVPQPDGDRRGLTFAFPDDETAAHVDEIDAIWQAVRGAQPDHVRVHSLSGLRIQPSEREDTLRVVDAALQRARGLPDPTFDCQDCSAPVYWTFGAPTALAEQRFGSPAPGGAWRLLDDQLVNLQAWLARGPAPLPG